MHVMIATLVGSDAMASPRACSPAVQDAVERLTTTIEEIRPGLSALVSGLTPPDPPAYLVSDRGLAVGTGVPGRALCVLTDGRRVASRRVAPLPGGGHATWTRHGGVLFVGSHEVARDGWDDVGWRAIVAHEWVHLHHFAHAERSSLRYRVGPLTRRLRRDEVFHDGVLALAQGAWGSRDRCDDPAGLAALWDAAFAPLGPAGQRDLSAWMFSEGVARHAQVVWEETARGRPPGSWDFEPCRTFDPEDYGYSVGCLVSLALDECLSGAEWRDDAWSTGFGPALARLRSGATTSP